MKTQNLIILIVFSILSVSNLEAKPRTVNINFDVVYPPLMPLETNIRSYYPVLLFEGNSKGVISDVSSIIKLNGYKKVSSIEKSDLLIKFIVNSVDTEVSIKRLEDIKSRGALATTKAMYTLKSKLSFNYIIKDLKNNRVIESKSSSVDTIYNSIVYSNYNRATKAANALKEDKARTLYEKLLINKLQCFINNVNSNYGYSIRTINLPISICENNDNFTAELKKAFSDFYLLRDVYKEEGLTDSIRTVINSCMNTWDKAISKYNLCSVYGSKSTIFFNPIIPIMNTIIF